MNAFVKTLNQLINIGVTNKTIAEKLECKEEDLTLFLKGNLVGEKEEILLGKFWKHQHMIPSEETIEAIRLKMQNLKDLIERTRILQEFIKREQLHDPRTNTR